MFFLFLFLFGSFWKTTKFPFSTDYIIPQKKSVVNSFTEIFSLICKKSFFACNFWKKRTNCPYEKQVHGQSARRRARFDYFNGRLLKKTRLSARYARYARLFVHGKRQTALRSVRYGQKTLRVSPFLARFSRSQRTRR